MRAALGTGEECEEHSLPRTHPLLRKGGGWIAATSLLSRVPLPARPSPRSCRLTGMPGKNTFCTPLTITLSPALSPVSTMRSPSAVRPRVTSRRWAWCLASTTYTYLRSWSVSTALSSTSIALNLPLPSTRTRANRPGVNARSALSSNARARMVPVAGSTWLSRKSTTPVCGKPSSPTRPTCTGYACTVLAGTFALARQFGVVEEGAFVGIEMHVHLVQRDQRGQHAGGIAGADQVAGGDQRASGAAADRRAHLGEFQVQARGIHRGLGGGDIAPALRRRRNGAVRRSRWKWPAVPKASSRAPLRCGPVRPGCGRGPGRLARAPVRRGSCASRW